MPTLCLPKPLLVAPLAVLALASHLDHLQRVHQLARHQRQAAVLHPLQLL